MPTKLFKKGQTPWNKGIKCSPETIAKISKIAKERGFGKLNKGNKRPDLAKYNKTHIKTKENHPRWNQKIRSCTNCGKEILIRGYKVKQPNIFCSMHCRSIHQRIVMKGRNSGAKCHFWKGGIWKKNDKIRHSIEYRLWRESVFARDHWNCQNCGATGKMNAHHIKSFSEYPELRFAIDNGITLCIVCHKKTNNYFKRSNYGKKVSVLQ